MKSHGPPQSVADVLGRVHRPPRAVVTAGMPYTNGPIHVGHLAGALLPPDIMARWLGMLIGRQNVLLVSGSDEHGSATEVAATKAGLSERALVDAANKQHAQVLKAYDIGMDAFSGTSQPECYPRHAARCQEALKKLHSNGLLEKRAGQQWFDAVQGRFLQDRWVRGKCPNAKCSNDRAFGDKCEKCGKEFSPEELIDPKSELSGETPVLKETTHWFLNMWAVSDVMREWLEGKKREWRKSVVTETLERVLPSLRFSKEHEEDYKRCKGELPKHKLKYAPGNKALLQFTSLADLEEGAQGLKDKGIATQVANEWAFRAITRDIKWGIPVPDIDPDLAGKTLYVWPDSLIAPISFSEVALTNRGQSPEDVAKFWTDPEVPIYQFLGQDNVFFYVLMQGALWLGTQADPQRLPQAGELQLTNVLSNFHLNVEGEKMSKSRGNFFTGEQLLDEKGYTADQIRYYLALLGLSDKPSDFDFKKLDERNSFLAGPINASFEKPISAAHSKFSSKVPDGVLIDKVEQSTIRMVQRYVGAMKKGEYPSMLFELENYARKINSLFTQYKPHDDRMDAEGRKNALYSSFYILKNLMIMLYPFVPSTMDRLRDSLRLPQNVFDVDELGSPIPAGHEVGAIQPFFPTVVETDTSEAAAQT